MPARICDRCANVDDPDRDLPCPCTAWRLTHNTAPRRRYRAVPAAAPARAPSVAAERPAAPIRVDVRNGAPHGAQTVSEPHDPIGPNWTTLAEAIRTAGAA